MVAFIKRKNLLNIFVISDFTVQKTSSKPSCIHIYLFDFHIFRVFEGMWGISIDENVQILTIQLFNSVYNFIISDLTVE